MGHSVFGAPSIPEMFEIKTVGDHELNAQLAKLPACNYVDVTRPTFFCFYERYTLLLLAMLLG